MFSKFLLPELTWFSSGTQNCFILLHRKSPSAWNLDHNLPCTKLSFCNVRLFQINHLLLSYALLSSETQMGTHRKPRVREIPDNVNLITTFAFPHSIPHLSKKPTNTVIALFPFTRSAYTRTRLGGNQRGRPRHEPPHRCRIRKYCRSTHRTTSRRIIIAPTSAPTTPTFNSEVGQKTGKTTWSEREPVIILIYR